MPKSHFTQRRVDALKPRKTTLDVRISVIRCFVVRILPSGLKRYTFSTVRSTARGSGKSIHNAEGRDVLIFGSLSSLSDSFLPDEVEAEDVLKEFCIEQAAILAPTATSSSARCFPPSLRSAHRGKGSGHDRKAGLDRLEAP